MGVGKSSHCPASGSGSALQIHNHLSKLSSTIVLSLYYYTFYFSCYLLLEVLLQNLILSKGILSKGILQDGALQDGILREVVPYPGRKLRETQLPATKTPMVEPQGCREGAGLV